MSRVNKALIKSFFQLLKKDPDNAKSVKWSSGWLFFVQ